MDEQKEPQQQYELVINILADLILEYLRAFPCPDWQPSAETADHNPANAVENLAA